MSTDSGDCVSTWCVYCHSGQKLQTKDKNMMEPSRSSKNLKWLTKYMFMEPLRNGPLRNRPLRKCLFSHNIEDIYTVATNQDNSSEKLIVQQERGYNLSVIGGVHLIEYIAGIVRSNMWCNLTHHIEELR